MENNPVLNNPVVTLSDEMSEEMKEKMKERYKRDKFEDLKTCIDLAKEVDQKLDTLHPDVRWKFQSFL